MKTIRNLTGYLLTAMMLFLLTGCVIVNLEVGESANKIKIWSHQAYLKALNAEGTDQFGYSVSISGDTIVVGANQEDSNQTSITTTPGGNDTDVNSNIGAAYVFVRSGETWTQQAYLKAPNAGAGDQFGEDVGIDDDTIIVGAWYEDSSQTVIQNSNAGAPNYGSDTNANQQIGAAYVFVRDTSTNQWSHQAYLKAPNAEANDNFGMSVAISGETVAVGARKEDSNATGITNGTTVGTGSDTATDSGAVYVFVRSGTTWSQEAYIKAPNPDPYDEFGFDVALHRNTIAVGAPLESSNETTIINGPGASNDNSVTNGNTYSGAGAAYVFVRNGTTWSQQAYLKAPNVGLDDSFGVTVAVSHDTIVVGAPGEDSNQNTITNDTTVGADPDTADRSGAAYVFTRSGTTWSHQAYLKAPNAGGGDRFGESVSVSGDNIVVGALSEDSSQTTITNGTTVGIDPGTTDGSGAAYVFTRSGTTWSHQAYLKAPNAGGGDWFGYSLAISDDTIVVGARREDSSQTTIINGVSASNDNSASHAGAAYVFVR